MEKYVWFRPAPENVSCQCSGWRNWHLNFVLFGMSDGERSYAKTLGMTMRTLAIAF